MVCGAWEQLTVNIHLDENRSSCESQMWVYVCDCFLSALLFAEAHHAAA